MALPPSQGALCAVAWWKRWQGRNHLSWRAKLHAELDVEREVLQLLQDLPTIATQHIVRQTHALMRSHAGTHLTLCPIEEILHHVAVVHHYPLAIFRHSVLILLFGCGGWSGGRCADLGKRRLNRL